LKIGVNATFLHEKPTGLGVFTTEISRWLSVLNGELLVFSPVRITGVPQGSLYMVPPSVKGSLRFSGNLLRAAYLNSVLPLLCRRNKIEVLFCPMLEFPFLPLVPLVVHLHDFHPVQFAFDFKRAATHFRYSLMVMKKIARRVTVSSVFVKKQLLEATEFPEERIDVVPLAYNSSLFRPSDPGMKTSFLDKYSIRGKYILSIGNLFPYKNIGILVGAFLRIKGEIPHSLVIVGRKEFASGPLSEDSRIIYTDYVPEDDLPKFYSYADLLVHPSLSEGFGMAPLEAMACGTPVLSSNGGSLPEVVGEAGILFDPRDGERLSELILQVVSSAALQRELAEKGLDQAKRFSWEKTASGIIGSCREALG
jgi:glycosyltransferase involved in cell wall biosynthesis